TSLLSGKPLQALGRRSYSWYLWHWPVLLLGATLVERESVASNLVMAGVSLVIAAISYRLVESPVRYSSRLRARPYGVLAGAVAAMAVTVSCSMVLASSARDWSRQSAQQEALDLRTDVPLIYG